MISKHCVIQALNRRPPYLCRERLPASSRCSSRPPGRRFISNSPFLSLLVSISAFFTNLRKAKVLRKDSKPTSKLVATELQSAHCSAAPITYIVSVTRSSRLAKQPLLIHRSREHRFWRSKAQLLSRPHLSPPVIVTSMTQRAPR